MPREGQHWTWATLRAALVVYGENGHLLWEGPRNAKGYGYTRQDGRQWYVHILAYTLAVGPLAPGQVLRRRCKLKNCCNPEHFKVVTRREALDYHVAKGTMKDLAAVTYRGGRSKRKVREESAGYEATDTGVQQFDAGVQSIEEG